MIIEQNTKGSWWTHTRLRLTVIFLTFATIVLLAGQLTLSITWYVKRHKAFNHAEKTMCVPCYDVQSSDNKDLTGFRQMNKSDGDYMTCCNSGSKVLDILIEKNAMAKHKELQSTRLLGSLEEDCYGKEKNPNTPYVKMTGLSFTDMENDPDDIILWNRTEHKGKVKPISGKIFIIEPGFYFVFSQIKLQRPIYSDMVHSHYVYLHSYKRGTLKPILENAKSFCKTVSANTDADSTMGAVFQLEEHDKLFVRSSHPQNLIPSEYSNEFGLYKM